MLRASLGESSYEAWIKPLRMVRGDDRQIVLSAPNRFSREWVRTKYLAELSSSLGDGSAPPPEVVIHVDPRQGELFDVPPQREASTRRKRSARRAEPRVHPSLFPSYTFENFIVGASNQFAHAAAQAVAKRPGEKYNPLFIYGSVGIGKTHLVNAIGHAILASNPLAKIAYLTSESFVNDLISSLRGDRMDDFKKRFRKVDILIVDDVQFIAGRERTQEEFFHTFNSLHVAHKQIVLTSDKFPKEIPHLEERLRNRFEWGLAADIQAPEIETRVAIVLKKAEVAGVAISQEVAEFIASKIDSNVREIEGALARIGVLSSVRGREITPEFAEEVLEPIVRSAIRAQLTMDDVLQAVAEQLGVPLAEIRSKRRTRHIATARHVAMYLCRELVGASFPAIGEKLGGRDHSTVIHARRSIRSRLETDPELRSAVGAIERRLRP